MLCILPSTSCLQVGITLTAADIAALDSVGAAVAGERYPDGGMRTINR